MAEIFQDWIGRSETRHDTVTAAPLRGLAALLDYEAPRWGDVAPPLAHWLYFLPAARQSDIDDDGHPKRGGFLPPINLPRRMWAGGRLTFHAPLRAGAAIERTSTIAKIVAKAGASGEMVFVTVVHEVRAEGVVAVSEEQDIVYRGASGAPARSAPARSAPDERPTVRTRTVAPSEALLFRYSALTFNAHRIHYDRDYATKAEGYPGLVVQGPLIATWLMDHWLREAKAPPRGFSFRAQLPLFDGKSASLCVNDARELWCRDAEGVTVMNAHVDPA